MILVHPDSPEEAHKLAEQYNKGSLGIEYKVAMGLVGYGTLMYPTSMSLQGAPFGIGTAAAVVTGATALAGLVTMIFIAPTRGKKRYARHQEAGHFVEIPNEIWERYLAVCKFKGVSADAKDFSANIPLLVAVIVPAHMKAIDAPKEQVDYLSKFIDAKLGTIADGTAAPLPHRANPTHELEALKTEFPMEDGPADPLSPKELE